MKNKKINQRLYPLLSILLRRHFKPERPDIKQSTPTNIKSLCFGLLMLTVCTTTFAQTNKFDIGAEGSPGVIFLRGNDMTEKYGKPTIGFSGGLFFQFNFKEVISLRTNIAYERKGSVFIAQVTDLEGNPLGEVTTHSDFDYLTFPVLARATFGKKMQFFVNAGPYFGYLIKQTSVSEGENIPTIENDNTSMQKRFDTGVSTGVGLSIPIQQKFAFSMEVRNNLGLYNTLAESSIPGWTLKNNSTNLLFGFTYKLGQRASD